MSAVTAKLLLLIFNSISGVIGGYKIADVVGRRTGVIGVLVLTTSLWALLYIAFGR